MQKVSFLSHLYLIPLVWSLQKLNWILGDNSKFNQGVVPIIAFVSLLEQINKEIQVHNH